MYIEYPNGFRLDDVEIRFRKPFAVDSITIYDEKNEVKECLKEGDSFKFHTGGLEPLIFTVGEKPILP